jgi:enoyl-CoA hydratase/carnithine racemase
MVVRLVRAWDDIRSRDDVRVVLVTGAAGRAFCAGADLASLIPLLHRNRAPRDEWDEQVLSTRGILMKALLRSTDLVVPIVAAVRGFALAGGLELVLAADLRVVSEASEFALTEVQRGLVPVAGGTTRLTRQVPWAFAAEILLLGQRVNAADALRMGLVNRVIPDHEVLEQAEQWAAVMARNGPLAVRQTKATMIGGSGRSLDEGFALEDRTLRVIARSHDAFEGPRAFVERREPRFLGR